MEEIMSYEKREELKTKGWDLFTDAITLSGKALGLLYVIESHYWRQREELDHDSKKKSRLRKLLPTKYSPGYELDIDHYTRHWLHSMRHLVPEDMQKNLTEEMGYNPIATKYLPDGHSLYVWDEKK